jgi:hypothetical protein
MLAHPFHRGFGCDKSSLAGIHIAVRWFDVEPKIRLFNDYPVSLG